MGNNTSKTGGDGGGDNRARAPQRSQQSGGRVMNAITKNKKTATMLEKKIAILEKKKEKQIADAKTHLKAGNKRKAMVCLKRKKMIEKQIDNYTNTIFTLEQQATVLEGAQLNANIVETMKDTKDTMTHINKNTDVDDVTDLMDELAEQTDNANDIQDALAQGVGMEDDEDELMAELEGLSNEDAVETVDNMPIVLPQVPTNKVQQKEKQQEQEEEDALGELEAMME